MNHKSGVAEFMAGLMSEGTKSMSSVELAEKIESRGATVFTRGGVDTVTGEVAYTHQIFS